MRDGTATLPAARATPLWWMVALALATGSVLTIWLDPRQFDWQPGLVTSQPWRAWSAAWVHWSEAHRWANLVGALLVGALGWRAACDRLDALAWFAAWPLTHLALLMQPALAHYGGLSGVLHAGVVVAAISLLQRERGLRRWLGGAIVLAVLLKIAFEHPWRGPLQRMPGWDIAIAPAAHLSGAAMGLACAGIAAARRRLAWRRDGSS
jgi:rhomboid family GlyGly-CTERM serine protease